LMGIRADRKPRTNGNRGKVPSVLILPANFAGD
jgi:hypothetical protein